MALTYGDALPADCDDIGPLLLRNFKDDGMGRLAKNDSPTFPSVQSGRLLHSAEFFDPILSNRDYKDEASFQNIGVCTTPPAVFFGGPGLLTRLRLEINS